MWPQGPESGWLATELQAHCNKQGNSITFHLPLFWLGSAWGIRLPPDFFSFNKLDFYLQQHFFFQTEEKLPFLEQELNLNLLPYKNAVYMPLILEFITPLLK